MYLLMALYVTISTRPAEKPSEAAQVKQLNSNSYKLRSDGSTEIWSPSIATISEVPYISHVNVRYALTTHTLI